MTCRSPKFLFPSPRNDGTQVLASFVRRAAGIGIFMRDGTFEDPIQILADALQQAVVRTG